MTRSAAEDTADTILELLDDQLPFSIPAGRRKYWKERLAATMDDVTRKRVMSREEEQSLADSLDEPRNPAEPQDPERFENGG